MKVLITGATGLVGSALSKQCLDVGTTVHYLTTSEDKIQSSPDYKGFYWNGKTQEIDENCFDGVTTIVHLAGATIAQRWTEANKKAIYDSRIKTAQLLYDTLERLRSQGKATTIDHFFSASAIGGYPSSLSKLYDEKYPTYATGFLGEVVEAWEDAAQQFQKLDLMTTRVRTGVILDKEEGALPKIAKPIKYGMGAPCRSSKQTPVFYSCGLVKK